MLRIAHRGGAGLWPENTMEAFSSALDLGVDGFELDVHLTKDGVLVIHHDAALKPAITRGPDGAWLQRPTPLLKELTFAELQSYDVGRLRPGSTYGARYPEQRPQDGARVPKLAALLELVKEAAPPGFQLFIELKTELKDEEKGADPIALAEAAAALVKTHALEAQVIFVSFDWRALLRAQEVSPLTRTQFTTLPFSQIDPDRAGARDTDEDRWLRKVSAEGAPFYGPCDWRQEKGSSFAEKMLKAMARSNADGWFAWSGDVTDETMGLARALGLAVSCWTVDAPDEMERLAALGVDAILTDRPDRLMAF
ncbi:glycerophosphodiester phosphodiesterase family protein [Tepidicaulis sp. LMO-SS28]|uniref:glycerophosphodiester phosphodiesterase family protein n=1 Tax=Tepidicaulis sp. LMO-SS28 TaxID=3447455 RepID=UPI003EDEDFD4